MGTLPVPMKQLIRISLLLLWLFAISAPSVLTMFHIDKPIVINTLGEEEPLDLGKKLSADEITINNLQADLMLFALSKKSELSDFYLLGHHNSPMEILLPPPKPSL